MLLVVSINHHIYFGTIINNQIFIIIMSLLHKIYYNSYMLKKQQYKFVSLNLNYIIIIIITYNSNNNNLKTITYLAS